MLPQMRLQQIGVLLKPSRHTNCTNFIHLIPPLARSFVMASEGSTPSDDPLVQYIVLRKDLVTDKVSTALCFYFIYFNVGRESASNGRPE